MDVFRKGLTHGFAPKMAIFSTSFFEEIQARKMSFIINQNEKTLFYAIKTRSLKSRLIDIFPKGLTHGFGPKMAIFETFFFRQYRPGKCFSFYSRMKKRLSRLLEQEVQKVQKLTFFLVQKWLFFKLFFFRQFRLGKCLL